MIDNLLRLVPNFQLDDQCIVLADIYYSLQAFGETTDELHHPIVRLEDIHRTPTGTVEDRNQVAQECAAIETSAEALWTSIWTNIYTCETYLSVIKKGEGVTGAFSNRDFCSILFLEDLEGEVVFPRLGKRFSPNVGDLLLFPGSRLFTHNIINVKAESCAMLKQWYSQYKTEEHPIRFLNETNKFDPIK